MEVDLKKNYSFFCLLIFLGISSGISAQCTAPAINLGLPKNIFCINESPLLLEATPQGGVFFVDGERADSLFAPADYTPGQHTITYLLVYNINCPPVNVSRVVEILDVPDVTGRELTFNCSDANFLIDLSGELNNAIPLQWEGPNGFQAISNVVRIEDAGKYTLMIGEGFCSDTAVFSVEIDTLAPISNSISQVNDPDCIAAGVELQADNSSSVFEYQWYRAEDDFIRGMGPEFVAVEQGEWILETIDPNNRCSSRSSILLSEADFSSIPDYISFSSEPSCWNDANGVISIENASNANVISSINNGRLGNVAMYSGLVSDDYSLMVETEEGCRFDTLLTVGEVPPFNVSFSSPYDINLGDTVRIVPDFNFLDPVTVQTILWESNGTALCEGCAFLEVAPLESTLINFLVEDQNGCSESQVIEVQVDRRPRVFIPNAFSPNGDGTNDLLKIFAGPELEQIKVFQVFDRWGNLLFERQNFFPDNEGGGWDGRYFGEDLPQGTYMWVVRAQLINQENVSFAGEVLLIR
jgi:gliding motility-associated-like protein